MCKTDPAASPRHRGVSILLVEHGPGLTVSKDLPKLGYKGVESCELIFEDCRVPATALLGGEEGRGFPQMMRGLETGRIQVAVPGARRRPRRVRGRPAVRPGPRVVRPADLAAPVDRQLPRRHGHEADRRPPADAVRRRALRARARAATSRRAWPSCSPPRWRWRSRSNAIRIHGGYGYSTEFDVERYFRDAPLMIVGEGTNEIQRNVIAQQLVERNALPT